MDLLRELRSLKPAVVHFSGHGYDGGAVASPPSGAVHRDVVDAGEQCRGNGLFFHGPDGRLQLVSTADLTEIFGAAGSSVELVVLNACHSDAQAEALRNRVGCVVAIDGPILDHDARAFAAGFYGGLAESESVSSAFKQGVASIRLARADGTNEISDARREPVVRLLVGPQTDPEKVCLVEGRRSTRRCSIVIKAKLADFDPAVIARVRDQLRLLTGDVTLEIIEVQEGSVRLTVALSAEAARVLERLRDGGELSRLCGFDVSSLHVEERSDAREDMGSDDILDDERWDDTAFSLAETTSTEPGIVAGRIQPLDMLVPGTILLDKYRIEALIGSGGMVNVVRALHLYLDQPVAIKLLLPEMAASNSTVQRFLRETQATVKLRSEHIARVMDSGTTPQGVPFMVMECLDGSDLNQILRHHGPPQPSIAVDLMLQACEGIAEAHALGIVHRDIKPSNFFVTHRPDGSMLLKILDFGISNTLFDNGGRLTGCVLGTPSYMAPERIKSGRVADPRSDIWSIGVVMYELLTGRLPFAGETEIEILRGIAHEPPRPPHSSLPTGLGKVLMRCLEKQPGARHQTVSDLARLLAPYASDPLAAVQSATRAERILQQRGAQHSMLAAAMVTAGLATTSAAMTMRSGEAVVDPAALRPLKSPVKILFVSANPGDGGQLAIQEIQEEYRAIEQRIRQARYRDAFRLIVCPAARHSDVQDALLKHAPHVVHFACHSSLQAEMHLRGDGPDSAPIDAGLLASTFEVLPDKLVLVVFNACFAKPQASAVGSFARVTIGMRSQVTYRASVAFASALYGALANGCSVQEAFELALAALDPAESRIPELFVRAPAEAREVVLVGPRPRATQRARVLKLAAVAVIVVLLALAAWWAVGTPVTEALSTEPFVLDVQLHGIRDGLAMPNAPFDLHDGDTVVSGDRLQVLVRASSRAILYVAFCSRSDADTGGVLRVFPEQGGISLVANQLTRAPVDGALVVDHHPGHERLYVIVSRDELSSSDANLADVVARSPGGRG